MEDSPNNTDRVAWAEAALQAFIQQTGCDRADAVCDLVCNLKHWCDANNFDRTSEFARGEMHYDAECDEDGPTTSEANNAVFTAGSGVINLIFARQVRYGLPDTIISLRVCGCEDHNDALWRLRDGVTKWMRNHPSGRAAWVDSVEDFNVGDLVGYLGDEHLVEELRKAGIYVTDCTQPAACLIDFDMLLPLDTAFGEP